MPDEVPDEVPPDQAVDQAHGGCCATIVDREGKCLRCRQNTKQRRGEAQAAGAKNLAIFA